MKGLSVGAYYSKPDWHSPLYWVPGERPKGRYASYDPLEYPERWAQYDQFVHDQLVEITRNYGDLDILWLDDGWVNKRHEQLDMTRIVTDVRRNQPDLLVVDRSIGGIHENYVTPERKIPDVPPTKAWESNIPLAKNWGFCANDEFKTFAEILKSVVKVVAMGGNIILGFGPKPDGTLSNEAKAILKPLGTWLATFGAGIYETRPVDAPLPRGWYATKKGHRLYLFHEKGEMLPLEIHDLPAGIKDIRLLATQETVSFETLNQTLDHEALFEVYQIDYASTVTK